MNLNVLTIEKKLEILNPSSFEFGVWYLAIAACRMWRKAAVIARLKANNNKKSAQFNSV